MGYLGKQPSAVPLTTADLIDGSVTNADIADLDAAKLTGTVNNARISLDAAEIPNLDAAKITTGDIALARLGNAPATDLTPIKQDIAMLALYNAVSDNRAAYNLPNSFIDQFEDDTGLTTQTDVVRNEDEYVSSVSGTGGVDDNTRLMLHMNDTGLTDSATYGAAPHTVTKVGSATRSDVQSKFGGYSYYADGSGDYLSIASHSDITFLTGAFTIDFWWRPTTLSGDQALTAAAVDGQWIGLRHVDSTNKLNMEVGGTWSSGTSASPNGIKTDYAVDTWYHIAVVREGSSSDPVICYVDGVLDISYTQGATSVNCTSALQIFGDWGGVTTWNPTGYLDEFRLSVGVARWTANFTPPTEAYSPLVVNATGTLISDQQTAPALTKMSGVVLVKDGGSSTTVMGTHLKIYFCATGAAASFPSAWVEADSYTAVTAPFSTGVTMYKLGETTVPSGTLPTIRAVWASQTSGGFESQLHGWAMNY